MKTPQIILIRGLPGSGKSVLAQKLVDVIGETNCVLLDPDATDYESEAYLAMSSALKEKGVPEKFYPYRFLRAQAHAGIASDKVIIWNQAFTNLDGFQKTVANLQRNAENYGKELPILVVEVEIDHEIARERIARRVSGGGHDVPDEIFDRFVRDYESFAKHGFKTTKVNGENLTAAAVKDVMKTLE